MNKLAKTLSGGYVDRAGNEKKRGGLLSNTKTGKNSAQQIVRSKFTRNFSE